MHTGEGHVPISLVLPEITTNNVILICNKVEVKFDI
jgi:hypothetical protein